MKIMQCPKCQKDAKEGILKGMYKFKSSDKKTSKLKAQFIWKRNNS